MLICPTVSMENVELISCSEVYFAVPGGRRGGGEITYPPNFSTVSTTDRLTGVRGQIYTDFTWTWSKDSTIWQLSKLHSHGILPFSKCTYLPFFSGSSFHRHISSALVNRRRSRDRSLSSRLHGHITYIWSCKSTLSETTLPTHKNSYLLLSKKNPGPWKMLFLNPTIGSWNIYWPISV